MNYLWNPTIDDILEIIKRAKLNGKKEGDSMEEEFLQYMKEKNKQPIGATELTRNELIKEYVSHDKNVLSIEKDSIKFYQNIDKEEN